MIAEESLVESTLRTRCVVCGADKWSFVRQGKDLSRPSVEKNFSLARCLSCGQIAQNPPPSSSDLEAAYSAEYAPYRPAWKERGWLWEILRELTTPRRISRLKRYAARGRLLEVGSGAGDFLYAANRAGWDVRAVEYSKNRAEALRNELGLDVRTGELARGMWEEGQFDLVVLWSVLEHVRNPLETLETASAYLSTGGAIFIQIPTRSGVELGEWFGQHWALLDLPRHLNFFGRDSVALLSEKAGLDLIVFKTPLLDTLWCYLASSVNYTKCFNGPLQRRVGLGTLAAMVLIVLPWLAIKVWQGLGTEAFAVAIKR